MTDLSTGTNLLVQRKAKFGGSKAVRGFVTQGRGLMQERSHSCHGQHRLGAAEAVTPWEAAGG